MTGQPFGDADFEDAWDGSDHVPVLLDNIANRLALLLDDTRPPDVDRQARIARLFDHLAEIRRRIVLRRL